MNENIDMQFFQLVLSLQAGAMQQMGKIASPITGKVERDLGMARSTIDLLEMFERKTKGNLDSDEKQLLDHVLYELRLNFVDEQEKDKAGTSGGSSDSGNPTGPTSNSSDN